MKEIKLTRGKIAIINSRDFRKLNQYKWHVYWSGSAFYAGRSIYKNGRNSIIPMHREIMHAPNEFQVDHKNGNTLDNSRKNLRLCTHQQNQHNRINPNKNNILGIKGICWLKGTGKFRARIMINKKAIHLGLFVSIKEADNAYRKAERKYFGSFARKY